MNPTIQVDPEARYSCTLCGRCCRKPWLVLVDAEKKAELVPRIGEEAFTAGPGPWFTLKKKPGTTECSMLGPDGLCTIHARWGEEAKPRMCRTFPYVHVASDEAVWLTASYGCKSVQEERGAPLRAEAAAETFPEAVKDLHPERPTVYPVTPELDLDSTALDQRFEVLFHQMDAGLAPALEALARWEAPEAEADPGRARYAFALTIYSDLVDESTFWGRLKGVWALPGALQQTRRYRSRLLGVDIDMQAVAAHPGGLPPESEALLLKWLRSRVRSRLIFKDVPHARAGMGRLVLHAAAVLYFARALAAGREITHADVLAALEAVELFIAQQVIVQTLVKLDPQLQAAWADPAVALAAARLYAPGP